jgi:hypothetical protein
VGDDLFVLSGQGSGSSLRFTYRSNLTNATLNNNGTLVFPTAAIGASTQVVLRIANEGTAEGTLSSAGIAGSNTPFSFGQTPSLPLSLEPGDAVEWTLRFRPSALGNAATILRIDGYAFTLSGVGEAPPAIPAVTFTGLGDEAIAPMEQLSLSLQLTEPYPLPLRGSLTIEHRTDAFASDPAVQFASGGRTAPFTIPAGATEAIFANQASSVRFQTGSVAGTIHIRPSFLTESGFDLTPEDVSTTTVRIPEATPVVLTSSIASRTATSFSLQLTAFATNRSISRIDIQFQPVAGVTVTTPSASLDVASTFRTWYQSQQSQQYGSLFTLTIPFNLQGSLSNGMSMIDALESVSVTMANAVGTSPQTKVNLK